MHLELLLMETARHATRIVPTTTSTVAATRTVARVLLLSAMVDALVIVQTVERAEDLVAQIADRIVQRLQVLLLLVPLQRQFCAEQFAADVATVARGQRQGQGDPAGRAVIGHDMRTAARGIAIGTLLLLLMLPHNTAQDSGCIAAALERNYVEAVPVAVSSVPTALVVMAVLLALAMMMMRLVVQWVVGVQRVVMPSPGP